MKKPYEVSEFITEYGHTITCVCECCQAIKRRDAEFRIIIDRIEELFLNNKEVEALKLIEETKEELE